MTKFVYNVRVAGESRGIFPTKEEAMEYASKERAASVLKVFDGIQWGDDIIEDEVVALFKGGKEVDLVNFHSQDNRVTALDAYK